MYIFAANYKSMKKNKQGRPKKPYIDKVGTMTLSVPNRHRTELRNIFKKIIADYKTKEVVNDVS